MTAQNPDGFVFNERGLFERRGNGKLRRIANPIAYLADVTTENSTNIRVALAYTSVDGRPVELLMLPSEFRSWPKFSALVVDNGYQLPNDRTVGKLIHQHLIESRPSEHRHIVHRIGWHGDAFVLPKDRRRDGDRIVLFRPPPAGRVGDFTVSGTLEGWRDGVATPALASRRLMLAIAMAFAAPLLKFTDFDNCGVHLFGPSSKGKTTCLLAAMSVSGKAERRAILTWNITEAGLAETAMGHCDTLMNVDELANAGGNAAEQAKRMRKNAFMLASGTGRILSKTYAIQHNVVDSTWRLMILSSGEMGLNDLASEGALQRLKGEEVRFIDVPAIASDDLGIYDVLPDGFTSPAKVSEVIEAACREHHGVALREFVSEAATRIDGIADEVATLVDRFMKGARVPSNGWEQRFARPFALSYAAACLAADWDILPWSSREIGLAVKACYLAARGQVPDLNTLRDDAVIRLREFLCGKTVLRRRNASDTEWTPEEAEAAEAFHRKTSERGVHFLIKPMVFDRLFNRLARDLLLKWLEDEGHLIIEPGRNLHTIQAQVPGVDGRPRYYAVKASVLRDERSD